MGCTQPKIRPLVDFQSFLTIAVHHNASQSCYSLPHSQILDLALNAEQKIFITLGTRICLILGLDIFEKLSNLTKTLIEF